MRFALATDRCKPCHARLREAFSQSLRAQIHQMMLVAQA